MIAYIEGRFLDHTESSAIVVTDSGVGYEIFLPSHTLSTLPQKGDFVSFYIFHVVREDATELFGFKTWDERATCVILTSINGVGARKALAILSTFSPDDLRQIIADNNTLALAQVSGIGKKGAQQIFLDLEYKLKGSASSTGISLQGEESKILAETITALQNLGYSEEEVRPLAKDILNKNSDYDVSAAIRATLKLLAQSKMN